MHGNIKFNSNMRKNIVIMLLICKCNKFSFFKKINLVFFMPKVCKIKEKYVTCYLTCVYNQTYAQNFGIFPFIMLIVLIIKYVIENVIGSFE